MTHSTADHINSYVDAAILRVQIASADLVPAGQTLTVIEGDEEPQYIKALPSIYVIPLGEGGDVIDEPQGGGSDAMEHTFTTTFVGFYRYPDITSGIRPVRSFAYNLLDLFTGDNQAVMVEMDDDTIFGVVTIPGSKVRIGYRRDKDFVVHAFIVTLNQIGV